MESKQGRLNTAKRRPLNATNRRSLYSLYYESSDDHQNANEFTQRSWKKLKPEEKEQQLISEFYQPIELVLLSEEETADSNQISSHENAVDMTNELKSNHSSLLVRKDHFASSISISGDDFHEPNDSDSEIELSSSLDAELCIHEDQLSSFDSQSSLKTSQSQESDKENIENSEDSSVSWKTVLTRKIDPSTSFNKNKHITDILELVERQHHCYGQKWNEFGIRKAISVLKNHPKQIKSGEEALKLKGIGKRIAEKIDQILQTGTLPQLTCDKQFTCISLFNHIWGVGNTTSKKLWNKGFHTLEELKHHGQSELNEQQRIGLKYYEELKEKIKREEVWLHGEIIKKVASRIEPALDVVVGGSYRRGREECGDIDIIITHTKSKAPIGILHKIVDDLKRLKYLTDDLEMTERNAGYDWNHHFDKYLGIAQLPNGKHRRIDIIIAPAQSAIVTLLYFTGSQFFNRSMRARAKKIGFYVCNHAISRADTRGKRIEGTIIPVKTEKEVFDILGMEYKSPEERDW